MGILTATPGYPLDIAGALRVAGATAHIYFKNTSSTDGVNGGAILSFVSSNDTEYGWIGDGSNANNDINVFATLGNAVLSSNTAGKYAAIGDNSGLVLYALDGNIGLAQTTFGTNALKVFAQSTGTAPTTSPADCFQMFSKDVNGVADKAGAHIRNENTGVLIVPGVLIKTDTGSPAYNFEGMICINTFDNTVDMYADAGWRTLASW